MSRLTPFASPLLVGFDEIERVLDRVGKSGEGYPPYNIERVGTSDGKGAWLRITLAVAGFRPEEIEVTLEATQLVVRGRQAEDDTDRVFLHRGIAARAFQRTFVLADGLQVIQAELDHGLLAIDLDRPEPERAVKRIQIKARD